MLRSFVDRVPDGVLVVENDSFMDLFETLPLEGDQAPVLFAFTGGISVRVAGLVEDGENLFEAVHFLGTTSELQNNEEFENDMPEDRGCQRPWRVIRP